MSEPYPQVPLAEVLTQHMEYIDAPEPKVYPKLSVRLYGKGVVLDTPADGSALKMKRHQIAKAGQVILSEIWGKKGAIGFVPPEGEGALCTSHFFLFDVRPDRIVSGYLQAIFTANYLEEQLGYEAKGTTGYAAVRPKHLLAARIPLPPLDEQRRIVSRIEELATKVEEARSLRTAAMEKASSLHFAALEFLFGEAHSKKWSRSRLTKDRLASVTAGQHIMAGDYNVSGEGVPYLTGPADFGPKVAVVKRWTSDPKVMAKPGDILLTVKGAGVGKINFAPDIPVSIGRQLMAITPESRRLQADFLFFFLAYKLRHFQDIATATTVPGFKKTDVEGLEVPTPSLSEQERVVRYLLRLEAKSEALESLQSQTAAELDALMPSILSKAFRGEL